MRKVAELAARIDEDYEGKDVLLVGGSQGRHYGDGRPVPRAQGALHDGLDGGFFVWIRHEILGCGSYSQRS